MKKWQLSTLGDVTIWSSGGTPSKSKSNYWNGDIPWISASSMKSVFLTDSNLKITPIGLKNGSRIADEDSVLILVRGSELHKRIPVGIAKRKLAFNQDVKSLKPQNGITSQFLLYWLLANEGMILSRVEYTGIGAGKLDTQVMQNLPVLLPPLPEQRAIAHILGTLDDKIELNRQMNHTLEEMARALFKSWFVDFDPVRAKAEGRAPLGMDADTAALFPDSFEDSELGEIPKGWGVNAVYDFAEYINGSSFASNHFSSQGIGFPIIKIGELKHGITNQTKFTDKEMSHKIKIKSGDILFSWSGSPDTSIDTFLWSNEDGWLNQHIFKINPNGNRKAFVYFMLKHLNPIFIETARDKQTTGLGHVTIQDLKRLKFISPPPVISDNSDGILFVFFQKIHQNKIQIQTLTNLRDTLLPKLISGEVRVKDAEAFLQERGL
jgi:type I restriction enzyme, S subunit